jgi:DNA repair exonuclease SbcCD ATPase subunit
MTAQESDEDDDTESELPRDPSSRLDAMQQERNNLRAEVTQLRQSLESLQERHNEELSGVKEELEQAQQGKEHSETQYRNLMTKVNQIRSQLGERLKEDAEQIREKDGRIEELEASNNAAKEENERLQESISKLNSDMEAQASEIESLRSRTNVSTTNWARERDDLVSKEAYIREEYEVARQAMQDWEILATEERSRREGLEEKAQELEDQLNGQKEAYERVKNEAETQSSTVDGLQRALRDLQEERKRELREMVEQSQSQLEELRQQTKAAEDSSADLQKELADTKKELERALPFEKEVKEKNLLLGKSRHQAVTLNEHLTRALRLLARGKPEENVNRHVVTNYLMQFLALDRSDAKKFQVLQLIAALLGWNEEQKEQAGLLRQGSLASGSLKLPVSPFRRTPSTPSLSTDFTPESPAGGATKESLAELWSEFLEREAEAGLGGGVGSSRRGSKSVRSPSLASASTITSPIAMAVGRQSPEIKRTESSNTASSARTAGSS